MIWSVQYAEQFLQDLKEISAYISDALQEPQIAEKQVQRILDAADALDHMPERYRIYEKGIERNLKIRILTVNRYVIFYQPDESCQLVKILRVIYGGRDIEMQLGQVEQTE